MHPYTFPAVKCGGRERVLQSSSGDLCGECETQTISKSTESRNISQGLQITKPSCITTQVQQRLLHAWTVVGGAKQRVRGALCGWFVVLSVPDIMQWHNDQEIDTEFKSKRQSIGVRVGLRELITVILSRACAALRSLADSFCAPLSFSLSSLPSCPSVSLLLTTTEPSP